jgi:hydroxymethylpyrimidine/phosphomethylpyrimidine kinase
VSARPRPPRLLTIAGSDSGGGAGIQADLKTFAAFGAYGMSAVTAVTAQNTVGVRSVQMIEPAMVADQIDAVFEDIGVDAVKIGMLGTPQIVEAVAQALARYPPAPMVLDPVMVAKSGDALLSPAGVEALRAWLLPRATLLTPNVPEAERLAGLPVRSFAEQVAAAKALQEAGPTAVLVKGGHAVPGGASCDEVVDVLFDGERVHRFARPRVDTTSDHGTGCTLSSAIAALLGAGRPLVDAVREAGDYLHGALRNAVALGGGRGPVDHLWRHGAYRRGSEA